MSRSNVKERFVITRHSVLAYSWMSPRNPVVSDWILQVHDFRSGNVASIKIPEHEKFQSLITTANLFAFVTLFG